MAGDQVQVVKDGDRRLGQSGTVVHIATQGAKVRFSDGQEEGFKRSSLLPVRAPQTAAQPLPLQRSQSAGAPPPPLSAPAEPSVAPPVSDIVVPDTYEAEVGPTTSI